MIPLKNRFAGAFAALFSSRKFSRRTRTARERLAALRAVTARQRFGIASRAAFLAGAMLLGSRAAGFGQGAITGDNQYNFANVADPFSTGFTPTFPTAGDASGQLNFGGTAAYTATDDLTSASVNDLTFTDTALVTIAAGTATNVLTLTNNSLGLAPSIYVGSGGATIGTILAGSNGFVKNGTGTLTLQTNADTFTGNAIVNAGTLTVNIGQASGAIFALANGATMTTNQALAAGNVITALTGTSTFTSSVVTNTVLGGNGNITFSITNSTAINQAFFAGLGGTAIYGNNNSFRLVANSNGTTTQNNPFTTLDFAAGTGGIFTRGGGNSIVSLGAIEGSGSGSGLFGTSSTGGTESFFVGSANTNTSFAGKIIQGATNTAFIKVGTGTLTLTDTAASTPFTAVGGTSLNGGTLLLNFATNNAGILAATGGVFFGGGSLDILGKTGANTTTQTVGAVTLTGAGGASLIVNPNGGTSTTLTLGALTATAAGGSLNIQPPNATLGTGTATITTTTNKLADGTYGARFTYGSDWATTVSTASPYTLSAFSGYTAFVGAGGVGTTDYSLTGSGAVTASETFNSLKITSSGAGQTLDLGGNTLSLTNGGLLFAGSNNYTLGVTAGDTLKSTSSTTTPDLVIQQLGTGNLTINAVIANGGTGAGTLTKAGFGTLTLTGTNTYTGSTFLNGGITSISTASGLGAPAAASTIFLNGGTLQATGTFSLAGGTTGGVSILGGGGTFDVTSGNNLTVTSVIANSAATTFGPLIKTDSGTLTLTGTNTYTGATIISGGVLSVGLLANGGTNSAIGNAPNQAPALILDGGTLQYTGAAVSTDRTFTLTQNGGTIDASGTGALNFTSILPGAFSGTGARTLTFTGTNTGANTFADSLSDASATTGTAADGGVAAASGVVSVVKSGSGEWVLSGNNTYSGTTTIGGGTLALTGATTNSLANSSVITVGTTGTGGTTPILDVTGLIGGGITIGSGHTLAGTGTVNNTGAVVIGTGGILAPGNNSVATLSLGALTLNNGSITNIAFGTSTNSTVASSGLLTLNGTDGVDLYQVGTTTKFTVPGTYTLFTYGSLSGTPSSAFSVLNSAQGETYAFSTSGNSIVLTISGAAAVVSVWNVDASSNYNNSANWTNGVPTGAGATASFGTIITAPRTVTVDGTFTVGEIDFSNANAYTLTPATAGNGFIFDNSGSAGVISDANGSHTVATPLSLALGLNVNVTNAGNVLTLSGNISNTGAANTGTVNKSGAGTLALLGTNTFDGGVDITNGTVQINSASSLGVTTGTATLDSTSNAVTLEALNSITTSRNFAVNSTNNNIQVDGTATYEIDGIIAAGTSGAGTLTKTGTGTLALGANDTFMGIVTVSAGTLSLGAGGSGVGSVVGNIIDNAALVLNRTDAYTLGNLISGTGTLTQTGSGNTTLSAANTFTGNTVVAGGTLTLGNALALQNSTLNYNNQGGTLSFGTLTAATLGGLSGSQSLALANTSAAGVTLTVGGNNATTTFSGALTGAGSIGKTGTGTLTLSNASYTGNTVAYSGGLTLNGTTNLTSHLDLSGQFGVVTALIDGATVTSNGGLYLTSPTGGTGSTIYGNSANLTIDDGAQVTANADANGRAISYGSTTANGRPSGTGSLTIGTAGDTSTLVTANGALDLFVSPGGGTVGTFVVNLNGGTLAVNKIQQTTYAVGKQSSVFHFNGGVLEALASDPTGSAFFPAGGVVTVDVDGGGAIINTNGFNDTIGATLVHGTGTPDGGLIKNGAGTLTLTAGNSYTGLTKINAGTLNINGEFALGGAVYGGTTFNGGTLQYATAFTGNGTGDITQNSTGTAKPVTFASTATIDTNGNAVTYVNTVGNGGAGGLTVADSAGTGSLTLDAAATYTGATTINAGATLQLGDGTTGHDGTILTSPGITDNGALVYNRFGALTSALPISGTGSVTVSGPGSQTLTGTNTYTGTTTVNGTLNLVGGSLAAASAVTVNSGGTLAGAGGTAAGTIAVNSGGTLLAGVGGATPTVGNLTTGAVTLNSGSTFSAVLGGDSSVSQLLASSTTAAGSFGVILTSGATFTASGEMLTLIPSGFSGTFSNSTVTTGGYTFTADYSVGGAFDVDVTTPVPEPATWLAGCLMVGALGYKKRKQLGSLFAA